MTTVLWISITVHVMAFLFWVIGGAFTLYKLKQDYAKREEELQEIYDSARETLDANIENVRKMAHTANEQYMANLYGGGEDGPNVRR